MRLVSPIMEGIHLFPRSVFKKWGLVIGTFSVIFLPWTLIWGGGSLDSLFSIVRYVGFHLGTGLPVVAGASLLICSGGMKQRIIEKEAQGRTTGFGTVFTGYLVLTLLCMTLLTLFKFCLTIAATRWTEILLVTPQTLAVTFLVTGLLCPIAAGLALAVDSSKISMLAGLGVFCSLMYTTGQPGFPVNRPEVALFGPAHLLAAMLFTITFAAEYPYTVDYYVGLYFTPLDLLPPLIVLILASVLSYRASMTLYKSNLRLWRATSGQWLSGMRVEEQKKDQEPKDEVTQLTNSLRVRRRDVETVVLLFVVLVPLTGTSYASVRQSEWTRVVYESPGGGETVEIGTWYYNSFEGIEPQQNVDLAVHIEGEILGGGGPEPYIVLNFDFRTMTLAELQEMNETEFEEMFGTDQSGNYGSSTTFSTGWRGPVHEERYVWVLRFLDVGGQTEGTLMVWFQVMIAST